MKWTSWVALAGLALIGAVVVSTSLMVGGVRCELCVRFQGREACRAVDGTTEEEARTAAQTNACALLASGVTQTMACERTPPASATCTAR
jgi:hypothetical protein